MKIRARERKEENQSVQADSQGHVSHYLQELKSRVLPVGR